MVNPFAPIFATSERRRLRRYGRVAASALSSGDPYAHFRLFNNLSAIPLTINRAHSGVLDDPDVELCVRQRLVRRLISGKFLGELMVANATNSTQITTGLPPQWRKSLTSQGFRFHGFHSTFSWWQTLLRTYLHGVRRFMQLLRYSDKAANPWKTAASLPVLAHADKWQISLDSNARKFRKDTVNWLFKHESLARDGLIVHLPGVKGCQLSLTLWASPEPFPPLPTSGRLLFLIQGVKSLFFTAIGVLTGDWGRAIFLSDEMENIYFGASRSPHTPAYLFCNPLIEFRPFWTLQAEKSGAQVKFLFYSANARLFGPGLKNPPSAPAYNVMNWPTINVWDENLAKHLRETNCNTPEIEIVGPIDYSDSDDPSPISETPAIAVFDVTAFQPCILAGRGLLEPYYTRRNLERFLDDISECLVKSGLTMLYKRKRPMIRMAGTAYRRKVAEVASRPNTLLVSPTMAPSRVIAQAIGSISIPYTSTALIGRALGVPSVYYDPEGTLEDDKSLSHDIPVLRSKVELFDWITGVSKIAVKKMHTQHAARSEN